MAEERSGSLSRLDERSTDRLERDLERAIADKMLARADDVRSITRDFDAELQLALPQVSDLDRLIDATDPGHAETNKEIQDLFALDTADHFAKTLRLDELMRNGAVSVEDRAVVRRGLQFLKRRMYREALEWWRLNQLTDRPRDRRNCLLLALAALTFRLAGDLTASERALRDARDCGL